ncbi:MAG: type II toxin-antitoxin system prevent-host-death family antitoxin [Gammaproteobacteria bacterium]|nr:type II toxin-antitoxin system prevent-host-death family antitoxin [Gammaproteobacteria bacterium]
MTIVTIHDAKTHLSKLINDTLAGKSVIIAKAGVPVVKLTKYSYKITPRQGGQLKGLINVSKDFDAPLPKDVLDTF